MQSIEPPKLFFMICCFVVTQVGLYHDQQPEEGGSSKENRNIYSESMPRRVGSFYRGLFSQDGNPWLPLFTDIFHVWICISISISGVDFKGDII